MVSLPFLSGFAVYLSVLTVFIADRTAWPSILLCLNTGRLQPLVRVHVRPGLLPFANHVFHVRDCRKVELWLDLVHLGVAPPVVALMDDLEGPVVGSHS